MKKFIRTFILAAIIYAMLPVACEKHIGQGTGSGPFEVSLQKPKVSNESGTQYVNVKCSGEWTLTLVSESGDTDWASLNTYSGTGDKSNVIFKYKTNSTEADRQLKIVLASGTKNIFCTFVQLAGEHRPDDTPDNDEDTDQGGNVDLKSVQWLELPAMNNPDLGYYTHSFKMDGKTYRNYSFGWSQKDRVALWVAYPLCKFYTNGSAGRTNAWALDPLLGEDSAAPFSGYAGPYARGHQLPSADRQCCDEANAQTFYGTNMTPQLNEHNEGIWSNLESKVRNIASGSDTTYVVTGVIVSPSSLIEKDSYGNNVTIPDAYFKVLLRYSKSSTLGQWNAAAFYLEHRKYDEKIGKQHSMSVDALEEMTGIDFFVNLPAKVGKDQADRIEAAVPADVALWW